MESSGHTLNLHNLKRQNHQELDELGSRGVLQAYLILQSISSSFHPIHFANLIFPKYFYHVSHLLPKCYRFQFLIFPTSQRLLVFTLPLTSVLPFLNSPRPPIGKYLLLLPTPRALHSPNSALWLYKSDSMPYPVIFLNHLSYMGCYKQQSGNTETERSPGIQGKPGYILSSRPAQATD